MAKQLVAVYPDLQSAQTMAQYLASYVDSDRHVQIITGRDQNMFMSIRDRLHSSGDTFDYDGVLAQGGAILLVDVDDRNASQIEALLSGRATADQGVYDTSSRYDQPMTDELMTDRTMQPRSGRTEGEERIELAEEDLQVGKRTVEDGGVRVRKRVVEEPVDEEIHLRDERVNVERRPVDRPLSGTGEDLFEERTIEMSERHEEPVVAKQARVTEEVIINKDVDERTEHVHDTVRRTEVEVDRMSGSGSRNFDSYITQYRRDFDQRYGNSGYSWDHYSPAYQLGHTMAGDSRYQSYTSWDELEPHARTYWEENHRQAGPWERFKDAAQHAWQSARGR